VLRLRDEKCNSYCEFIFKWYCTQKCESLTTFRSGHNWQIIATRALTLKTKLVKEVYKIAEQKVIKEIIWNGYCEFIIKNGYMCLEFLDEYFKFFPKNTSEDNMKRSPDQVYCNLLL